MRGGASGMMLPPLGKASIGPLTETKSETKSETKHTSDACEGDNERLAQ